SGHNLDPILHWRGPRENRSSPPWLWTAGPEPGRASQVCCCRVSAVNGALELRSRLEAWSRAGFDGDFLTSAGIAPGTSSALTLVERAKAGYGDLVPGSYGLDDRVDNGIQRTVGLSLSEVGRTGDRFNEFLLVHYDSFVVSGTVAAPL